MANVTLQGKVVLASTHEGFCSWSMLQGHFARVSRHEGAFSSLFNLPQDLAPKYLKPSTHIGFCSWSMLPGHYTQGSIFKFVQFALGSSSQLISNWFNILLLRMNYTHENIVTLRGALLQQHAAARASLGRKTLSV